MSKSTPGRANAGAAVKVRSAVTTADSASYDDAHYDPTTATITAGYKSVQVFPRFTAGTSPTVTIQVLFRATSATGKGWMLGPTLPPLAEGAAIEVETEGRDTMFAVAALTGSPTSVDLWCAGWERLESATQA